MPMGVAHNKVSIVSSVGNTPNQHVSNLMSTFDTSFTPRHVSCTTYYNVRFQAFLRQWCQRCYYYCDINF